MTTSIAQPQHPQVSMCGMKTPLANNQGASEQTALLQNIDLSALEQSHANLYDCGKQVVEQNKHLLASPPSEPSLPGFHSTSSADFEAVLVDSKLLDLELKLSDDDYMAMGRRLVRSTVNQSPPHIKALENLIKSIHTDYQQTYAKINEKAAEFMKDANTAIGRISDFITAGSDGKIKLHSYNYLNEMSGLLEKYTGLAKVTDTPAIEKWANGNMASLSIHSFKGDKEAEAFWTEKLGKGFTVKYDNATKIVSIYPNLESIRNIYKSVIANAKNNIESGNIWGKSQMSSASFQSLQSAIDSQKNTVNSSVSQLLERFRQDNSTFETMIQLLQQMTQDLHRYNAGYFQ
ncbi:TPA: IpaD/SipD/SspD family type III secretion system needle tip protein [Yersinia enterocolitica]|nr:IpaD/SipD/SspD family type III secretion system needle tip protein [Yersinia enterocolitica]HDL7833912.1 IpaD/SipD/SspD family type III secretion system needle tip protein [Yersinia enterocolitica]HDL7874092.1 IpaD/SipD/SspD family type III secretion system needle tip protein [Yersinia enterocolitica]HDL7887337.1 IpaD/SipD/SspD family type III secretion system needle tip protein [Yersinia enterocolitica]HDL7896007.1 IpaD/SipD/SspD family type III secretion system needle tip protein [Yersinia